MLTTESTSRILNAPSHTSLSSLLQHQAEQSPDAIALLAPNRARLTYRRLCRYIGDIGRSLNSWGLGRHDRIALVLPNGPEMAVACLGVAASATCAPLNPAYSVREFSAHFNAVEAKALVALADMPSPARTAAQSHGIPIIELLPNTAAEAGLFTLAEGSRAFTGPTQFAQSEDVAFVLPTSGTTSRSKIVPLTHAHICTSAHNTSVTLALCDRDLSINVLPLFHVYGLVGTLLASLTVGASTVCLPGFDAVTFFDWLQTYQPTWYAAVPTMHQMILSRASNHLDVISRCPLRLIRSASAPLPVAVLTEVERVFGVPVIENYGMTEAASQITCNPLPPRARKPGSVGIPAGPEVAIIDDSGSFVSPGVTGQIVIRGASVIQGYDRDPEANDYVFQSGWLQTGDVGYLDTDGYLFITGRLKELINRGGENIAPREIDEVLMQHPDVAQAAAFAVPHEQLGEDVAAAVVLHPHARATRRELRAYVAMHLSIFKIPREFHIVDQLPKTSTGKLRRVELAESFCREPRSWSQSQKQAAFIPPPDIT